MTIALIDADIVAFRVACTVEQEEVWIGKARCDEMMQRILEATKADTYQAWLSGDPQENFRYKIYPEYKANRTQPRPRHLEPLREYLVEAWGARLSCGFEADDALGINATDDCIICSIDKDLLQIPGKHWNFVKEEYKEIDEQQGLCTFYRHLLIGDASDNVRGVKGIGKVKAERIVLPGMSEREMFEAVRIRFSNDNEFILAGNLIYILRNEGEVWSEMKRDWFENIE